MDTPRNLLVRQLFPTPDVPAPTKMRCVTLYIPDSMDHLAAFAGAVALLGKWNSWQKDEAHTARLAAFAWQQCMLLGIHDCATDKSLPGWGGGNEEIMVRQDPDNPCLLQSSIDGINWCTFADLSLCLTPSAQPGAGAEQPSAGGGQVCYHARMPGSGTWLLPTVLNSGDVVGIEDAQGAVSSSYNGNWYCPSGSQFFGGLCVGFEQMHGGNPVPAAPDESLVININGTYYSLNSGAFTVPGGVSNAQAFIQVNDATLAGKQGDLTFSVCVTNNQATTWTLPQNLALQSGGWTVVTDGFDGGESVWTAGAGWQQVTCHSNLVNTGRYDIVYITLTFDTPTTLNHVDILYDATVGDLSDGGGDQIQAYYSGAWHTIASQASANGTNRTLVFNGSHPSVEKLLILLYGADLTGTSCPTPGTVTLKQVNMNGVGAAPF